MVGNIQGSFVGITMTKSETICVCGDPWLMHQKEEVQYGCTKGTCLEEDCPCEFFIKDMTLISESSDMNDKILIDGLIV